MTIERRRGMIEAVHADLSVTAQCRLLSISRSSFYYTPQPEFEETLALMRVIDTAFLDMPGMAAGRWSAICGARASTSAAGGCDG